MTFEKPPTAMNKKEQKLKELMVFFRLFPFFFFFLILFILICIHKAAVGKCCFFSLRHVAPSDIFQNESKLMYSVCHMDGSKLLEESQSCSKCF